jgi:hypothetical protein
LHYIELRLDGKYEVGVFGQSGYERTIHDNADEAVESYRHGVAWLGGPRCKPEEVKVPCIIDRTDWPLICVKKNGQFQVSQDQFEHAVRLAVHQNSLECGREYRLRISFHRIDPPPQQANSVDLPIRKRCGLREWVGYFLSKPAKPRGNMDLDEVDVRGA